MFQQSPVRRQDLKPRIGDYSFYRPSFKIFLLILWETKSLDNKKYIALSLKIDEIGRMLGAIVDRITPCAVRKVELADGHNNQVELDLPNKPAEGACFYEISSISEKYAPQHAWRLRE